MLLDIINAFCTDTGYDPVKQRTIVLQYINRAAFRIYQALESDDVMREMTLSVPRNMQVSIPAFVGQLRGVRETFNTGSNCEGPGSVIPIFEIGVPRYTTDTSKFRWRNWTYKGVAPLSTSLTASGPLTFEMGYFDTNVNFVIIGKTGSAAKIKETLNADSPTVTTTNSWSEISSITCSADRTSDVSIKDLNGVEVAVLYNNETSTRYGIIDVAQYAWANYGGPSSFILAEVLYKAKFYKFVNDEDTFVAEGFDEAILAKAMVLWYAPQEGKENQVVEYTADSQAVMDANTNSAEGGTQRRIQFAKNPIYTAFSRLRRNIVPRIPAGQEVGFWPSTW